MSDRVTRNCGECDSYTYHEADQEGRCRNGCDDQSEMDITPTSGPHMDRAGETGGYVETASPQQ
jgi:hypothetical protein